MLHQILADKQVVLASASPRRKIIFELLGIKALVLPSEVEENEEHSSPQILVQRHAYIKAEHIAGIMPADTVVVGSDTIVYHNKEVLGKPADKYVAYEYLQRLSGQKHYVYSGVAVSYKHKIYTSYTRTAVEFNELSRAEIEAYIETGEPMDKAGAYGIQGYGAQFIKKINGCYFTVMGFPITAFYELVNKHIRT
ncbi:MAG: Maf family protein [Candidatus Cloacimonetes bacterium]|nr:Maf family protein [Candidatus Cloacimonadota bacterium]